MKSGEDVVMIAARSRGLPLNFSWDKACRRGYSYQGYGLDQLLRHLLLKESEKQCSQCGAGDCSHEAARLVIFDIRLAETRKSWPTKPGWWQRIKEKLCPQKRTS